MRCTKMRDERKQEIIDTAKRLFFEHGVEHTTISMLVEEMGVAHGLFYYYFKSKDEVIKSVLEDISGELKKELVDNIKDSDKDFIEKLRFLIKRLYEIYCHRPDFKRLEEWVRVYFHDKLASFLTIIIDEIVQEGIRHGFLQTPDAALILRIAVSGCIIVLEKEQITCDKLTSVVFQMLSLPYEEGQTEEVQSIITI